MPEWTATGLTITDGARVINVEPTGQWPEDDCFAVHFDAHRLYQFVVELYNMHPSEDPAPSLVLRRGAVAGGSVSSVRYETWTLERLQAAVDDGIAKGIIGKFEGHDIYFSKTIGPELQRGYAERVELAKRTAALLNECGI